MQEEGSELKEIYSEINSIESKIGGLQRELKNLKDKLEVFVQKKEKSNKDEYIIDPVLEEELTSPITGSYESVSEEIKSPIESKPLVSPKTNLQPKSIVRPSLVIDSPSKKVENIVIAKPIIHPAQKIEIEKNAPQPPDLFDDIITWIKGKIGNIPIEEFLGVNLLNKIGLLLLVIGFSFFLRLAYDWIGPYTKISGMLLLSIVVYWGGDRLYKNKSYTIPGLGMIASAFSIFYFTVYASYNIEATRIITVENGVIGFILLFLASIIIIGASLWYKKEVLTSFAYFLGFITISINEKSDFNYFSMASVLLLSISLIGIMTVMRWKYLTGIGIFASYANYWLYAQGLPRTAEGYLLKISETGQNYFLESVVYLLLFWIIFFVSTFTMKVENKKEENIASAINIINAFSFFGMFAYIHPEPTEWGPFTLMLGMGIVYIIGAFAGRRVGREFLWISSIILGISLITLSIPSKFSDYGHVFGWLIEGSVLIVLGFIYKEVYIKNLGYLVLFLNLGKFFTLPYGDFYYSSTTPLFVFDLNRGLISIFMLIAFFGLIPIMRKYLSNWSKIDKIAYTGFGFLGSFTLFLFSFYLTQKPYQAYVILPGAGLLLGLSYYFKNRNFYYASVSLTVVSLLASVGLMFPNHGNSSEFNSVLCSLFIIFANGIQYYLGKEISLFKRYLGDPDFVSGKSSNYLIKSIFMEGQLFIWIASITFIGLTLNEFSPYLHSLFFLIAAICSFAIYKKFNHGNYPGIVFYFLTFVVGLYRYKIYSSSNQAEWGEYTWVAIINLLVFWISGFGILYLSQKNLIKEEFRKILNPALISATTLVGMLIGNILIKEPYLLSFASIYSLLLLGYYKYNKEEYCIYNSILISWFTLLFSLGAMVFQKTIPGNLYEYANLTAYVISSILTTVLSFHLTKISFIRISYYVHSLLASISFIIIVVPDEFRPLAFLVLHMGIMLFHFKSGEEKFYEYSYLTLGIAVFAFLYQTDFLSSKIAWDTKGMILVLGYAGLFALQTVFIFLKLNVSRERYLYYILNFIIVYWAIYSTLSFEYTILLFSGFVYINGFLLARFQVKEIEKLYYYPLLLTVFSFLIFLGSNKQGLLEEMDYKNFFIGIITLFALLRGVKDFESYKATQTNYKLEKYSFEKIITLILFSEFILLTMTVVDVRFWSLIWTIEAFIFITYGVFRNQSLIRYAGFGLIGLAVVKLVFWDLQNLKENIRVLVLISIGGLFVISSFLYAKYKDKLFKVEDKE